jgi:hypothetical protein
VRCAVAVSIHFVAFLDGALATMTDQERLHKNAICDLLMVEGKR